MSAFANGSSPRVPGVARWRALGWLLACIALAIGITAISLALPAWRTLERQGFDSLTVAAAPRESSQPIVLVAINEESFEAVGHRWPWPRGLHAELLDRLTRGGAAVVAFDVLFADAGSDAEDEAFAKAMQRAGNVVLAADFTYTEDGAVRLWKRTEPLERFLQAGAVAGLATVPFDPDTAVRKVPPEPDAFWRQVVKVLQVRVPTLAVPPLPEAGSMIRFLGGTEVHPAVPFHLVLSATDEDLRGAFEGRIVLVGRDLRAAPELGMAQADIFRTAFTGESEGLQAGYRIHATLVENALTGTALRPAGILVVLLLNLAASIGTTILLRRAGLMLGGAGALALLAAVLGAAWLAFTRANIWLPVASTLAVIGVAWVSHLARSFLSERARRREVKRAFSLYVAPTVVDRLLSDPRRLALGGESREVTVMFTDLAGFTQLVEKTPPDVVAQVLSEHFTAMTDIILEHGGTVDKFIGDAIVAFWGAPLDDPSHRRNAVSAAIAMQAEMHRQRQALAARGLPAVHMRVGLNSGVAIVGNMGSRRRFSYTVLGDCVNLAARLEGANKLYGTGILLSGDTAGGVGAGTVLRPVDRIRVAGRSQPVDVLTPDEDASFASACAAALVLTHAREWDAAQRAWEALLGKRPDDAGAQLHLARIAAWRPVPPPAGWDGSVSLDKM